MKEQIKPFLLGIWTVVTLMLAGSTYYLLTHNVTSTEREPDRIAMRQMPEDTEQWK